LVAPQISVVMAVRDGERWLSAAIASIQRQTFSQFELIIIDDGSTDETSRIIDAQFQSDPRIIAIHQDRLGLVAALNRGLAATRGQFVARLDADDIAEPERLARQFEYLERHPEIGLVGTWAHKIDEQGTVVGTLTPPTGTKALSALLNRTNPFLHSSIMMRKNVLEKVGFFRTAFAGAEDYDLWIRMSEISGVANIPEYLLRYRIHSGSVTHTKRVRQLFSSRLAQQAAQGRRTNGDDPASELNAPPDWHATDTVNVPVYPDLTKLFRFLDLADAGNLQGAMGGIDISALSNPRFALNHAERRVAQIALLNLLKSDPPAQVLRSTLLWHFFRLHPVRAVTLGYREFLGQN
jgi:glycosyltransferase involved in cell wall biosynthesis